MPAQEKYLFANEGDDHANNVKALESLKKGTEDWQSAEDPTGSHSHMFENTKNI